MSGTVATRSGLVRAVRRVQTIRYDWPGPPTADGVREAGVGTCAGKHALLAEELRAAGFRFAHLMVVGRLAPALWPDLVEEAGDLLEVHQCLSVETDWKGPLRVDVTWHPAAVCAGLPGSLDWSGERDMVCAVDPVATYAVTEEHFREQKELLRGRLYSDAERERRDRILAEMAQRAAVL